MRTDNRQHNHSFRPTWTVWIITVISILLGAACFAIGFAVKPLDTWLWLVVWFLVFGGLAQGMLVWAATFRVAQARWTPAINRLGHSAIAFLPISYVVMIVLLFGAKFYVPWVTHPVPAKAAWLNLPFMWVRDLVSIGILGILNFLLVRWSLVTDEQVQQGDQVTDRVHYRISAIAVAVLIVYTLAFSIISYDFIMSLSPRWFSTMFAPYYWITNAYAALALLVITSHLLRRPLGVSEYIGPSQFNDLGNLMLGFSLFSMGLFFAQYLTIWYENLPDETFFLIIRYYRTAWQWPGWISFILGYALPFVLLQSRSLKHNPKLLSIVSGILIIGVALERYVLVVPSVMPGKLGLFPLAGFGGLFFIGLFALAIMLFLRRCPAISSVDEALQDIDPLAEALP